MYRERERERCIRDYLFTCNIIYIYIYIYTYSHICHKAILFVDHVPLHVSSASRRKLDLPSLGSRAQRGGAPSSRSGQSLFVPLRALPVLLH